MIKYLLAAVALFGLVACQEPFKPASLIVNSIEVNEGCSGTLLDETHVLTAAHCVMAGPKKVKATHRIRVNSSWFTAYVVKYDEEKDLALMVIPGVHFKGGAVVAEKDIEIGDTVFVIGRPRGMVPDTVNKGSVSYTRRGPETDAPWDDKAVLHQLDISAAPGNSGSGVFNEKGELVGVLVRGINGDYEFAGQYAFVVMLEDVRTFLDSAK